MKIQTLSAAVIALMSSAALAGNDGVAISSETQVSSPGFVQLDTNADGTLDKSEVQADANLGADWKELDRNDDGTVSRSEFSAFESDQMEERADRIEDRAEERAERMEEHADQMEERAEDRM